MTRMLAVTATAVVLLAAALPAFAEPGGVADLTPAASATAQPEPPSALAPVDGGESPSPRDCDGEAGLEVVSLAESLAGNVQLATPAFDGEGKTSLPVVVDLGAAEQDTVATIDVTMTWKRRANDFDLEVASGDRAYRSEAYQPVDDPVETVRLDVAHCDVVELTAVNFLAPGDGDRLRVSFAPAPPQSQGDDHAEAEDAEVGEAPIDADEPGDADAGAAGSADAAEATLAE